MEDFEIINQRWSEQESVMDIPTDLKKPMIDSYNVSKNFHRMILEAPVESSTEFDKSTFDDFADDYEEELIVIENQFDYVCNEQPTLENLNIEGRNAGFPVKLEPLQNGSLRGCKARFNGLEDMGNLDDFLIKVTCYKTRFDIPDHRAIAELQFLLHGLVKTWWENIKVKPRTWSEATGLIRRTFQLSPLVEQHYMAYTNWRAKQAKKPTIDYLNYC